MKSHYSRNYLLVIFASIFLFLSLSVSAQHKDIKTKTPIKKTKVKTDKEVSDLINQALDNAYNKYKDLQEGKNADYIPELANVPPDQFAIVIVTANGKTFKRGDVDSLFSIQSISKVFTMASDVEDHGSQAIQDKIGVDPTGERFNSALVVERNKGQELNPLVNAGAIAATSMVNGTTYEEKWRRIMQIHNDFAGRELSINEPVYKSEAATNQHNQALAYLMNSFDRMYFDPLQSVDIYTKQCAINVNTVDLAVMAATLANGGTNPITKKVVVSAETVSHVLPVMATAGLYDDSGIWLYNVGVPAKSGVGGGIIAVVPGQYGIAAFSPRLDQAGNSVRAQRAIADIVNSLKLNPYMVQQEKKTY